MGYACRVSREVRWGVGCGCRLLLTASSRPCRVRAPPAWASRNRRLTGAVRAGDPSGMWRLGDTGGPLGVASLHSLHPFPSATHRGSIGTDLPGSDPDYIMQLVSDVRRFADVLLLLKDAFRSKGEPLRRMHALHRSLVRAGTRTAHCAQNRQCFNGKGTCKFTVPEYII